MFRTILALCIVVAIGCGNSEPPKPNADLEKKEREIRQGLEKGPKS